MVKLAKTHWSALAAFAAAFLVYLRTLCPTVYVEGSGELIGAAHFLGTPHPTGYPLFCLVGRLFSAFLPLASAAYEINVASAFTGALAVLALAALVRERGLRHWSALGTGLVLGFSRTFWSQAVIAEVYGLSTLFAVVVIAAALRAAEQQEPRLLTLAAFLAGLGLTAHLNQVLIWPGLAGLLLWRWPAFRQGLGKIPQEMMQLLVAFLFWRWRAVLNYLFKVFLHGKRLGAAILALAGGYSLVLYLPLRSGRGPGFHWGPLDTPDQIWDHLTGAIYRSSFFSMPWEAVVLNARRWGVQVGEEFGWLLVPLIGWGVWCAFRRDRNVWVVAGTAVLMNLAATLNYHRDPNGLGVFFLLSFLGLAIFLGYAVEDVGQRLHRGEMRNLGPVLVGVLVPLAALLGNYGENDRSGNRIPYEYGCDILEELPPGAVLITEGDDASYILDYLQRVEGKRPDVILYNRVGRGRDLLTRAERRRSRRQQAGAQQEREAALIRRGGRPVFYSFARKLPLEGYRFVPAGLTYRIVPMEKEVQTRGIDLSNAQVEDLHRDPWVRKIQANYWFMVGEQLREQGKHEAAYQAFEKAAEVAFDSRTMRFNVAVMFYRNQRNEEAMEHARAARDLDPWQANPYRLMGYIKRRQGRLQEATKLLKRAADLEGFP